MKHISSLTILLFVITVSHQEVLSQNKNIDSLCGILLKEEQDTNRVIHLIQLGQEYNLAGRLDNILSTQLEALELAYRLDFKKGIAEASDNIGIYYLGQSNYSKALDYFSVALGMYKKIKNQLKIAEQYSNIANVYSYQADYSKALDFYFKALKIAEDVGEKNDIELYLGNIGNVYYEQREHAKALEYYFKALKMAEILGVKNHIIVWLGDIGTVYCNKKDYSNALTYYLKALKMSEELGNKNYISAWLINLGDLYQSKGDYSTALDYYFKALKMKEELKNKKGAALCFRNIGTVYTKIGKFKEAEKYLKDALQFDVDQGMLNRVRLDEEALSMLYDTIGLYKLALVHYKKSMELKDTLFSRESKKQLVQKEMTYQFEKKESATKAENDRQQLKKNIIIGSVAGGLFLVLVFSIFVFRSLRITRKQKQLIEVQKNEVQRQKELVEEKQQEIISSITYAKRIQSVLITSDAYIKSNLSATDHFVLFKPRDIVSGDFYWAISVPPITGWDMATNKIELVKGAELKNIFYMITADCTGHGVPGAFMSMLNISYLHENIVERGIRLPNDILNTQRKEIITALNPEGTTEETKDGMDCTLCVYDFNKMLLHFAAANNPLWLLRPCKSTMGGENSATLTEYKADKMPVGKYGEKIEPFTLHTIELQKGDIIYTSTDGFADQFGGNGKKLMKKRFKEELLKIHHLTMQEQKEYLTTFFEDWKSGNEQIDDVTVVGIRV